MMKRYLCRSIPCCMAVLFCSVLQATELFGPSIFSGQSARIDILEEPLYLNPQYDLQYLIVRMARNHEDNHFCLVGYRWPDGDQQVAVYWQESRTIYLWNGRRETPDHYSKYASSLLMSSSISLDRDVVERQEDMGMATYLRSSVDGTIADCKAHGTWYRVEPFQPPKDGDEDDEGWE